MTFKRAGPVPCRPWSVSGLLRGAPQAGGGRPAGFTVIRVCLFLRGAVVRGMRPGVPAEGLAYTL